MKRDAAQMSSDAAVRLRVGGEVFEVEKEILLKVKGTYFYGMLSSGAWNPDADGVYTIDRPAMGFDRILAFLSSGQLSVEGLSLVEEECLYSNLDYFLIPYRRQWHYTTQSVIDGLHGYFGCKLKDGRLCVAHEEYYESNSDSDDSDPIVYGLTCTVWNMDTNAVDITLEGHASMINEVIQLHDGRVCSCSNDATIKLWSIDSGQCELTLTDHTKGVWCIIQLFDGRVCSSSWDKTIKVFNISNGLCELTINTVLSAKSLVQVPGSRICYGDFDGSISMYSLLTGECELSWKGHSHGVNAIVYIDATRVCSGSSDSTIKVWSIATGECGRTLEGHTGTVSSMVLMQDGRLCSASTDRTLKLWNLETGECEKTLKTTSRFSFCTQVLQLDDGRLLDIQTNKSAMIWS